MTLKTHLKIAGGSLALMLTIINLIVVLINVDAGNIAVHQNFTSGALTVWDTPGIRYKGWGTVTVYPRSAEHQYIAQKDPKGNIIGTKDCLPTRFNDKGKAVICGQVSFDLPDDPEQMKEVHRKYRSISGIRNRIIEAALTKAVYNTGPLMSSQESAGKRRSEILTFVQEQAKAGVYVTEQREVEVIDLYSPPIETVEMREVPALDEKGKPRIDEDGNPVMKTVADKISKPKMTLAKILEPVIKDGKAQVREESVALTLGFNLYNFTVDAIVYDPKVKEQIDRQRDMEMRIRTKIAEADTAQQDAVTSEAEGKAKAAKAKWEQETIKAQQVTEAEQKREVAAKDLETAQLEKKARIARAEGEAKAKKLVMDADGALEKKLVAYVEVNKAFAAELGKQRWVPDIIMGGGSPQTNNPGMDIMRLLAVKAAKDLALNPNPTGR